MPQDSMYVMDPMEIAVGWLGGTVDLPPSSFAVDEVHGPRAVLEHQILRALRRSPCGVSFSGGRDSSAILAIATDLARREGLPAPIPVSKVFPAAPETDESEWQELVIRHLGLDEWVRLTLHDELDIVGPYAVDLLRRHGVAWPPMLHSDIPVLDVVRGGSLLTGEGGDEVLGVDEHRVAPIHRLVRHPRTFRRRHLRQLVGALSPARLRASLELRHPDSQQPWLRSPARAEMRSMLVEQQRAERLGFGASLRAASRLRANVLANRNEELLAAEHDVTLISPLADPAVIGVLAADGGWLGRGDRTTVLRWMVGDLLPDAVLTRTSKALFDETFATDHTADFVRGWSGDGVDAELVDADALRQRWLSGAFEGLAASLLQAAWLADQHIA